MIVGVVIIFRLKGCLEGKVRVRIVKEGLLVGVVVLGSGVGREFFVVFYLFNLNRK